jgi:ABC-type antimicrobial peptide transport system permease subunit
MFSNYIKIAWRHIVTQRLHTLLSVGSLSMAITAVVLIMLWVQNEFRFDDYHPAADRIFLVTNQHQSGIAQNVIGENSPYPLAAAMKQQLPDVELVAQLARSQKNEITLNVNGNYFTEKYTVYVDPNWFRMFHYEFLAGSPQSFLAHPYSLMLTQSKARQLFNDIHVTGRRIRIDSTDYVVQAVIKDNPINSSFQFDVLIPLAAKLDTKIRREEAQYWLYPTHKTFVRLHPSANPERTAKAIADLYKANRDNNDLFPDLLPLLALHFQTNFDITAFEHTDAQNVSIFILLALVLLVSACVNYVNLSIARTGIRSKEIGVRKIIGANRSQLFGQIMSESVLISLLAVALSVLLTNVSLPAFNTFTNKPFTLDLAQWHIGKLLLGTWVVTLLLISVYPALLLSSVNPLNLFRGTGLFRVKNTSIRKGLITVQFSMTVVMVIGVIVVYRQVDFMQRQHNAYNRSQLLTIQVPDEHIAVHSFEQAVAQSNRLQFQLETLKQRLLTQSSIKQVARMNLESVVNHGYTISGNLDWDGRAPDFQPAYVAYGADTDINSILNFKLVQGRWFNKALSSDKENAILNETAVKQFGLAQPVVGKRFSGGVIIGVVKDFYYQNMREKVGPVVIKANETNSRSFLIETQPGQAVSALNQAIAMFKSAFPNQPRFYSFMDEEFDTLYRKDTKALQFMLTLSGLSILISCMGLFGIVALSTEQRQKEISIRKVLGASVASVVALLSRDFLKLVLLAIVIASPVAWYALNRWLQDFAHKVTVEWWIFALSGLLALLVALLTVSIQSAKAALVNPVKSLKTE